MRRTVVAVSAASLLLLGGCGSGGSSSAPTTTSSSASSSTTVGGTTPSAGSAGKPKQLPWLRPADQLAATKAAGLSLTPQETLAVHYHAHLDVFVDGKRVTVPAGLGINVGPNNTLPPHGSPGIAPLHTHDTSGVLHIEAPQQSRFTLGQVFAEWGVPLSSTAAGGYTPLQVYVDGKAHQGDPTGIVLTAHEEIAVVAGRGHVDVPKSYSFPAGE